MMYPEQTMTEQRQFTDIKVVKCDSPENVSFLMRRVKLPWKDLEVGDSFLVPLGFFTINPNTKTPIHQLVTSRIRNDLSTFTRANYKATGVHRQFVVTIRQEKDSETGELLGMRVTRDIFDVVGIGNAAKLVRSHKNGVHSSQV